MLTDFEGMMFFDATFKPDSRHVKKGLKIDLNWKDYVEKFDELWQLSKPAVEGGSLEKLFTLKPKDRVLVDKAILEDLENWREHLAKNLFKNNHNLFHSDNRDADAHYLKEVTQKILDRIIFIRFCEDRNLTQIRKLKPRFDERGENTGTNTYVYILGGLFKEYFDIFNSDLFKKFDWETDLKIEFKVMNEITQQTYDPYMFDAIPLEVLGNIYEQYLGYTIKLAGDNIKYELKPEVRKAGGIYYTPEYIVDYIVNNTMGKLLTELSETKAKKIRVLDPACGSGSFLIRAYDEMMRYYLELKKKGTEGKVAKRNENDKKIGQVSIEAEGHEEKLTIEEKANILKEHIYGVDIDDQAVEVTKLSLMLKMLEGEWGFVKGTQVLPMLDKNIKCGNSLVSGNVLELNRYFGEDFHKIKPFNWEEEFKGVIVDEGGFDVVIGNPPYVKIQTMQETNPKIVDFLKQNYKSAQSGNYDLYIVFIEKGIKLLRKNGYLGYITPHKFFNSGYGLNLRTLILKEKLIKRIVHFGDIQIFENATTYTCLLFIQNNKNQNFEAVKLSETDFKPENLNKIQFENINADEWSENNWNIQSKTNRILLEKFKKITKLEEITTNIFQGPKAGADNVFILKMRKQGEKTSTLFSPSLDKEIKLENTLLKKYIKGKFIKRYFVDYSANEYAIFPYDNNGTLLNEEVLKKKTPLTYQYLISDKNIEILNDREEGRFKKQPWQYSRPQNMKILYEKKILTPFNAFTNSFAIDAQKDFIFSAGVSGAYGIIIKNEINIEYEYLLGVLNSTLVKFVIFNTSTSLRGGFYSFENKYIKDLPIVVPDIKNSKQKNIHNNIVELVKLVEKLTFRLQTEKGSTAEQVQSQIDKTNNEIDKMVYQLYGLTEEEIKVVECK
jgi:type I restriction-modification system DNA methylase subunit